MKLPSPLPKDMSVIEGQLIRTDQVRVLLGYIRKDAKGDEFVELTAVGQTVLQEPVVRSDGIGERLPPTQVYVPAVDPSVSPEVAKAHQANRDKLPQAPQPKMEMKNIKDIEKDPATVATHATSLEHLHLADLPKPTPAPVAPKPAPVAPPVTPKPGLKP